MVLIKTSCQHLITWCKCLHQNLVPFLNMANGKIRLQYPIAISPGWKLPTFPLSKLLQASTNKSRVKRVNFHRPWFKFTAKVSWGLGGILNNGSCEILVFLKGFCRIGKDGWAGIRVIECTRNPQSGVFPSDCDTKDFWLHHAQFPTIKATLT